MSAPHQLAPSFIPTFPLRSLQRLHDRGYGQEHRLGCWTLLKHAFRGVELNETVTRIISLGARLRVDDNADTAQLLAKLHRNREHGAHQVLTDTHSLSVAVDRQPGEPENRERIIGQFLS